jgi:hypothetical protein
MGRAPSELNSGLGFGLSCLLVASLIAIAMRRRKSRRAPDDWIVRLVRWTPFIGAAVFMSKSALSETGRYITPYYPLLLPAFLLGAAHSHIVSKRWWRLGAYACGLLTIGLLLISRQRPIFPADFVTAKLQESFPNSGFVRKVRNAYSFVMQREEMERIIRAALPAEEKRIGYAANKATVEPMVWRSAPGRRVYRFNPTDDISRARALGIRYILVDTTLFWGPVDKSIDTWLERFPGKIVAEIPQRTLPEAPPEFSYIVKLER